MSTIVVVEKEGRIAIGADSLIKYGYTKQSAEYLHNSSKIVKIGDNYMAIVGYAAWDLVLRDYIDSLDAIPPLENDRQIFHFAREMHSVLKERYFVNPKEDDDDPVESSQMDCLIANPYGIFGLYALRSVGHFSRFYALGAGFKFALGAMYTVYDDPTKDARAILEAGLEASAEFDDATAGPFEIHEFAKRA